MIMHLLKMQPMDDWMIVTVALIAALILSFILYYIIFLGSYGRKIWTESRKQTAILEEIAKQQGVDQKRLDSIMDPFQYKETI